MNKRIHLYTYKVRVQHDKGTQLFTIIARDIENVIKTVQTSELCPIDAIKSIRVIRQVI